MDNDSDDECMLPGSQGDQEGAAMYMNVFSTRVPVDSLPVVSGMFRETMANLASDVGGFRGMLGLVDDETGDILSVALNENSQGILDAREHSTNQAEVAKYAHLFEVQPSRSLYRLDVRYMPHNRPFPGDQATYTRATWGNVAVDSVASTIAQSRDSLIYSAIFEKGCAGFLLGSNPDTGKIIGFSLWQSLEYMLLSEGEEGYYQREMARYQGALLGPAVRRHYRVFDRLVHV